MSSYLPCETRRLKSIIFLATACTLSVLGAHSFAFAASYHGLSWFRQSSCRAWATGFDSIAQLAFEASHVSAKVREKKEGKANFTWGRGNGGLDDSDRDLLVKTYRVVESVFEFGLGESTRLAAAANVIRYTGVDSDAAYVAQSRDAGPSHYKFVFADIGQTRQWGYPKKFLRKQSMQYQIAPLLGEMKPFDVYFIDGRFRVACVCSALLHASKFGRRDSSI
jgi:hypothetical protein